MAYDKPSIVVIVAMRKIPPIKSSQKQQDSSLKSKELECGIQMTEEATDHRGL